MKIIAVSSNRPLAGKSTFCIIFDQEVGYSGVPHFRYSDPGDEGVAAMFGREMQEYMREHMETPLPWLGKTGRQVYTSLLTGWGQEHLGQEIWAKEMSRKILIALLRQRGATPYVLADGLRFEVQAVHLLRIAHSATAGFKPSLCIHDYLQDLKLPCELIHVRIRRPEEGYVSSAGDHVSEQQHAVVQNLIPPDYVIANTGAEEEFIQQCREVSRSIIQG